MPIDLLLAAATAWTLPKDPPIKPGGLAVLHRTLTRGAKRIELDIARFDTKAYTLRVVDNKDGTRDLPVAMAAAKCVAGVNGGYFHADRSPLGLVIADGKTLHREQVDSGLLTGIVTASPGRFDIWRVAEFPKRRLPAQALQVGPFLVDHGLIVKGLEATRAARRTAVVTDGKGLGALLACDSLTLAEFAELLATPGVVPGVVITRALNLDGGSSTMFYAAKPSTYRPGLASVRNYLGIMPR
ncbi:MAG: phosphodiester glycosidase [Cyanobacteria bacterium RYN_339]|nr:phosphodiester glycosidase [Cyanobacteria bacterium RYN_339]